MTGQVRHRGWLAAAACAALLSVAGCSSPQGSGTAAATGQNDPLTGYGASDATWNSLHTPDPSFPAGVAYDPNPAVAQPDIRGSATFLSVQHGDGGHIIGLTERFAPRTPLAQAAAAVARQLPPDAQRLWFAVKDTCAQAVYHSATLARLLSWGDGRVLVEYSSGPADDHYDPMDVTEALLAPVLPANTPADAPAC